MNRFALNPTNISIQRSMFGRTSELKTSFNAGKLIPIYCDEVLPGDTFSGKTSAVIRMGTPVAPVMDDAFIDVFYFFVPMRLVWNHWEQFNGQNDTTFWTQTNDYTIPTVDPSMGPRKVGDLGDYFGIPIRYNTDVDTDKLPVSELPFRAYFKIWNDNFRDQNTQQPVLFNVTDDSCGFPVLQSDPLPVNKYHDYFTSCLPQAQKGAAVQLPLGDIAPVITTTEDVIQNAATLPGIRFDADLSVSTDTGLVVDNTSDNEVVGKVVSVAGGGTTNLGAPSNMAADLANATAASINSIRLAFQLQKILERDARGGTRYIEVIKAHFGVTSPDSRLQRPEYLGGAKIPVVINQVLSTTAPQSETAPATIGTTGAFSLTGIHGMDFSKSFTEHGYLIGVACIRTNHTYGQGISRMWTRKSRFDFYLPALANIGEQPVKNTELVAVVDEDGHVNTGVFGYQEAWAEYRYKPNMCTAYLNPNNPNSLKYWTFADEATL